MRCFGTYRWDRVGSASKGMWLRMYVAVGVRVCDWKCTSVGGFGCVVVPADRTVAGVATESVRLALAD